MFYSWRSIVLFVCVIFGLLFVYLRVLPDRYDIFAPLDLVDSPTFVTPFKMKLMSDTDCIRSIQSAGVKFSKISDRKTARGCGFRNAVEISKTTVPWANNLRLSCPMAASMMMWELHDLQPTAQKKFGTPVALIENYGTYSCRNINNKKNAARSQHAMANAIDISGFVLKGGKNIVIRRDWTGRGDEAKFLAKAHRTGCFYFNTVLGPEYNDLHKDHFHLDQGDWRSCR